MGIKVAELNTLSDEKGITGIRFFNPFYTRHMASKYTHVTRTFGGKSMLQKINPPTAFQILFPRILHCLHAIVIHQMKDKECSISII